MIKNDKYNNYKIGIKNIIFNTVYCILIISLFDYFFYCISKVPPSNYISKSTLLNNISTSVGIFDNSDIPKNSKDQSRK